MLYKEMAYKASLLLKGEAIMNDIFHCPICSQHMYDIRSPVSKDVSSSYILYCPNCGYYKEIEEGKMHDTSLFLKLTTPPSNDPYRIRPWAICQDGFTVSIQASRIHYCRLREDNPREYETVELGYPSIDEDLIAPYAENENDLTHTVYAQVPIELVDQVLLKHGGIVDILEV